MEQLGAPADYIRYGAKPRTAENTLTRTTTYALMLLGLLMWVGCGCRMTTTKARLIQPSVATDSRSVSQKSEAHFENGLSLFRAGQEESAAGFFVKSVEADSTNWKAHYYLSLVHKKHSAQRAALAALHAALTYAPEQRRDRSLIYLALGELFEQGEDFSRAQLSYRTALNLYPGSDRAMAGLNRVQQSAGKVEK